MVARWLERGAITGEELLEAFSECIQLLKVPDFFGNGMHPRLAAVEKPWQMRVEYPKVFYHCDLDAMFTSQAGAAKYNERKKGAATRASARLIAEGEKVPGPATRLHYAGVLRHAMSDHMRSTFGAPGSSRIHSAKPNTLDIVNLEATLNEPRTKRSRVDADEDVPMILDVDASTNQDTLFYEIVWQNLGKKRRIPVAVGAGQHLRDNDCGVFVHTASVQEGDACTMEAHSDDATVGANYIIRGFCDNASIEELKRGTFIWQKSSRWVVDVEGCRTTEISNLLEHLIDEDALPDRPRSGGLKATSGAELHCLGILLDRGFVQEKHGRWFLTESGWGHSTNKTVAIAPEPTFIREDTS